MKNTNLFIEPYIDQNDSVYYVMAYFIISMENGGDIELRSDYVFKDLENRNQALEKLQSLKPIGFVDYLPHTLEIGWKATDEKGSTIPVIFETEDKWKLEMYDTMQEQIEQAKNGDRDVADIEGPDEWESNPEPVYHLGEGKKFARKCDVTGEGMNKGWLFGHNDHYIKYQKDVVLFLKECGYTSKKDDKEAAEEDILQQAYDAEFMYYTEWEDEDDFQYQMINGELIEIED